MQIGLKDKNNRDICEGHIVKHLDGDRSFAGVIFTDALGYFVKGISGDCRISDLIDSVSKKVDLEIIGSIY